MAALEQIQQLRQQGLSDNQIINSLQEQGISPREINEALSQSEVKSAITPQAPEQQMPEQQPLENQPQEATNAQYASEQYAQQPYPQEQYAQTADQGQNAQEPYYQQAIDTETIREIAKQIIETELEKTKSQITEITKLKTELKFQIENIDTRLTKIENSMESLQSAILKKVGDFGEAVQDISKDLQSTQESFSKLVNPLVDQKRGKPSPKAKSKKATSEESRDKSSTGFEDYFR